MNYIKEAENILWYYRDLYRSLDNMQNKIGKLISSAGPRELKATVLDDTGIKNSKVDDTLNIIFEIQVLTDNIRKTKAELEKVDLILDELSQDPECELFSRVLRMWYIERVPKEDIARELGYSSKQSVYDIRAKAIRKFAVRLFGLEALKAV